MANGHLGQPAYKWAAVAIVATMALVAALVPVVHHRLTLCHRLLPRDDIVKIRYFTARISARPDDPQQAIRQETYLRALATLPLVELHFGHYVTRTTRMALADPPPTGPRTVNVLKTEEKGSDVNLATYLLLDAFQGRCETAVVITNDSDLAPSLCASPRARPGSRSECWTRQAHAPTPDRAQVAALKVGFERALSDQQRPAAVAGPAELPFTSGNGPVYEAMMIDRAAFLAHPIAPLPDFYEAAGLTVRDRLVAAHDFDWDALSTWQTHNLLREHYGFDAEQVDRFEITVGACLAYIDEGAVALGADEDERDAAAILISTILDDGAADLLARAVSPDCYHLPALLDAAGFASDRGDAQEAQALVRRTGIYELIADPDLAGRLDGHLREAAHLVAEVDGFARNRPPSLAGRNDRCPCGDRRPPRLFARAAR